MKAQKWKMKCSLYWHGILAHINCFLSIKKLLTSTFSQKIIKNCRKKIPFHFSVESTFINLKVIFLMAEITFFFPSVILFYLHISRHNFKICRVFGGKTLQTTNPAMNWISSWWYLFTCCVYCLYICFWCTAKLHITGRNSSALFVLDTGEVRLGWTGNTTVGNEGPSVLLSAAVLFPAIYLISTFYPRKDIYSANRG